MCQELLWFYSNTLYNWLNLPNSLFSTPRHKVELVKTHLDVFANHGRDYMTHCGHWEICKPAQIQSVLTHMLIPTDQLEKAASIVCMT